MPATTLTITEEAQWGEGLADLGFETVDQPNSNDFTNTGKERVYIDNASGGAVVATHTAAANARSFNKAWTKTLSVAAGDVGVLGPFPVSVYGTTVQIDWDVGTSITVAVVRSPAPQE